MNRRKEKKREFIPDYNENGKGLEGYYRLTSTEEELKLASETYLIEYQNIENLFNKKIKLNSLDLKFLFFATALQCIRQYIFTNDAFRFENSNDGDKFIRGYKNKVRDYHEILFDDSVPYDCFLTDGISNTGISGANHRYTTLGHDPLLGWIFGTMNIITNTLTKNDMPLFTSYNIENKTMVGVTNIGIIIKETVESIKNDYKVLPAALIKQGLHYGSDVFTKMGLPLPILNNISPNLNSKLLSENFRIDTYSVTRGAMLSMLINSIISGIHGLFYKEGEAESRELYEVRTRKILLYSNSLATSSNVIYTALSKDFTKLDVGGMLVTIYRICSDIKFINKVKQDFIESKLDEKYNRELEEINRKLKELGVEI